MDFEVDRLCIRMGNFSVTNVSFKLKEGDILGLVGRSGAGKSTLINALVGMAKAESGRIIISGDDQARILIGYSPQSNSLFPFLTLKENLMTFAELYNIREDDATKQMNYLLKRLDLAKFCDYRINQLSGGMQKRADLAVSLIHSPSILILDEPFNGLDIALQKFIWTLLHDLADQGKIIIISSHMISDIQSNCTKLGLVEKGEYFNNEQIAAAIKSNSQADLTSFLQKLFTKDLLETI